MEPVSRYFGLEALKLKVAVKIYPTAQEKDIPSELLPQQGQHALWQLVGLRHHRRTGLLQNLRT